jgi:hypothetical protein
LLAEGADLQGKPSVFLSEISDFKANLLLPVHMLILKCQHVILKLRELGLLLSEQSHKVDILRVAGIVGLVAGLAGFV